MNNLTSEKPIEVRKLIDVAYLVLVLAAFAWAKEFLLPLILAIVISFLLAPALTGSPPKSGYPFSDYL